MSAYSAGTSCRFGRTAGLPLLFVNLVYGSLPYSYFTLDLSLWIIRTVLVAMGVSTAPAVVISILFIAVNGVKYLQHTLAAGRY